MELIFEETRDGVTYKVEYEEHPYLYGRQYRILRRTPDSGGWSAMYAHASFWKTGADRKPVVDFAGCERFYADYMEKTGRMFPGVGSDDRGVMLDRSTVPVMFAVLSRLLPYGVVCAVHNEGMRATLTGLKDADTAYFKEYDWKEDDGLVEIQFIKPYLRPMESMTDEERRHLGRLMLVDADNVKNYAANLSYSKYEGVMQYYMMESVISYLSERRLDYGKLIGRGLALEAPAGMYETGE